ncbi:MerR family transcriptional regulator [Devosia sp. A8/3-2]|nr:MerR family transcriptional regulator [Devosia sp. A8/3-2]
MAQVFNGEPDCLGPALAAHQTTLEGRLHQLAGTVEKVRHLRADLARGQAPAAGELPRLLSRASQIEIALDLPRPWGGERFELTAIKPLTYIIGPLGSGKTRLAQAIAATTPGAIFLGLDRLVAGETAESHLANDTALNARVEQALTQLTEDGATPSPALTALIAGLEIEGPTVLVVDMVEQGLDQSTREAVIAHLRHRGPDARPLFLMTRSCAILDLTAVGADEAIVFCPANHSPPSLVAPYPGAAGYEAVATCPASPEVRARTEGVIARRPQVA